MPETAWPFSPTQPKPIPHMTVSLSSRSQRGDVRVLLHCFTLLAAPAAFGQAANPVSPADTPQEDMLVLSPFEVNPDDNGYLASSAQSGTRLRTDLRDIPSSISVLTKDFMND